ncbi:MAG: SRPBCC domain-containing protein [Thermoplasmata archaeon]|nr:SRPBCC domain-containing protein [Thermoplasmata archaeon]
MAPRNLRQSVTLPATPHDVYEALVDPKRHAAFSGARASMARRSGAPFSHYDGSLTGFVVELVPDRRIVLAWRANSWPAGEFSIARFALTKLRGGTRLVFDQYGIPSSDFAGIQSGWRDFYWTPLRAYFEA